MIWGLVLSDDDMMEDMMMTIVQLTTSLTYVTVKQA